MALATAGVASGDSSFFPYFIGTWTRGSALLLGAAVALAIRHPSVWERMRARPGGELHLTPFFLLGLAFVSFRDHHVYTAWLYNRGGYLLVALVSMWAILDLVRAPNSVAARLLAVPPLVALGKRSYSIYLWHLPIIWYVRLVLDISYIEQPARMVGTSLALTMVAAELSYRLIEQPFRKLGRRLSEEPAHLRA